MRRVLLVGLFVVGMIMMVRIEADAGCLPSPPSPKYCATWIVGSVIGENLCQIDTEIVTRGCTPTTTDPVSGVVTVGTCPTTVYTVSGTINASGEVCDLNNPDECFTPVFVTCWQKQCERNPNRPECDVNHQTTSVFNFPGLIGEAASDQSCQKKNCRVSKTSATFFTEEDLAESNVCARGHVVKEARVLQFVGGTTCCSGGYDDTGACCNDQSRLDGLCGPDNQGTPKTIKQICCNGDTLGVGEAYTCFVAENGVLPVGELPAGCNSVP